MLLDDSLWACRFSVIHPHGQVGEGHWLQHGSCHPFPGLRLTVDRRNDGTDATARVSPNASLPQVSIILRQQVCRELPPALKRGQTVPVITDKPPGVMVDIFIRGLGSKNQ